MDQKTYDEIYNQTLAEINSYSSKATVPKQVTPQFKNEEEYLRYLGVKPKETGLVKGTVKSLGRGIGGAISQFGKALEYDQNQRPDLVNTVGSYIDDFGNRIIQAVPQPVADRGSQREAWFQAMESTPTSLAMGVPAMVGGALGSLAGPAGTVVGAALGGALSYPIMQQATAQETYETLKARRPDLSEETIRDMAAKTGYWEAGPEAVTNIAEGILFNTTPLGRGISPFVKAFGKNVLKAAPLEMAGEAATGYGQASTLKPVLPELDPTQEALHGANVATYMSLAMAGGGTVLNKLAQPKEIQPSANLVVDNKTTTDLLNEEVTVDSGSSSLYDASAIANRGFTPIGDITSGVAETSPFARQNVQFEDAPIIQEATEPADINMWIQAAQRARTSALAGGPLGDIIPSAPVNPAVDAFVAQQQQAPTSAVTQPVPQPVDPAPVQPVTTQPTSIRDAWGKSTGKKEDTRILQLAPESLSEQDAAILDAGLKAKLIQTVKQADGTTTYHLKDDKTRKAWPNLVDQYNAKQGPLYEASIAAPKEPLVKPVKPTRASVRAVKQQAAATAQAEAVPATVKPKGVTAKVLPADLGGREVHTVPFSEFSAVAKEKAKAAGKEYNEELTISSYLKRARQAMEKGATDIHADVLPLLEKRLAVKEAKGVLPTTRSPIKGTRLFSATPNKVDKYIKNVLVALKTKYKLKNVDALLENPDEQDIISRYGADYDTYYRERVLALANELAGVKWKGNDYNTYISTLEMLTARVTGNQKEVEDVIEKKKAKQKAKREAKKKVTKEEEEGTVTNTQEPVSDLVVEFAEAKGKTTEPETEATKPKPILRKKKETTDDKEDGTRIPSGEQKGQEPEQIKPVQGPSEEKTAADLDVQTDETKGKTSTQEVNQDAIQTMKVNLSDLEQQISEETDPDEIAALKEEARQIRRAIKAAGGRVKKSKAESIVDKDKVDNVQFASILDGSTPTDIVDWIINNATLNRQKDLATYLKNKIKSELVVIVDNELIDDSGKEILGEYDPKIEKSDGTYFSIITLNMDYHNSKGEDAIDSFLHELVHHAINDKLDSTGGKIYRKRLLELKNEIQRKVKSKGIDYTKFYGLRDESILEELITEAFTNSEFQELLNDIKVTQPKGAIRTLFDKFVAFALDILNMPISRKSALEQVITLGTAVIEEPILIDGKYYPKQKHAAEQYWAKTFFGEKQDATVDYLLNTQVSAAKKIKGMVEAMAPDMNLYETVKGFFRNPFFLAEKVAEVRPVIGNKMSAIVKASENKTEHYNNLLEKFVSAKQGTKNFDDIRKEVDTLTKEQQVEFIKLTVLGDMLEKEFNSINDIPKNDYINQVSQEAFKAYKDLRNFSNKLYEDIQDEMLNTVVLRYNKSIRQKLKKFIKDGIGNDTYTETFINAKVSEIMDMQSPEYKEKVKEITIEILDAKRDIEHIQNQIGKATGYMPRIRKPGKFKLEAFIKIERMDGETKKAFEERKKANRVYMELFPTKMHRDIAKKHMQANLKDVLGPAYKSGMELEYVYDYVDKGTFDGLNVGAVSADLLVEAALNRASAQGDLNGTQIDAIKKILSRRVAEVLLGDSAGRHKISRVDEYITGFNIDPMLAFQTMINNMSLSIAKSRYAQEQMKHYKDLKEMDKEAAEWAFEYIKTTLTARTKADMLSAKARYFTTFFFMGFNIGSAIINMTQNLVIGVPELSRYTSTKDAIAKLGKYMALVVPQDVVHQYNSHIKSKRGIAEPSKEIPVVLREGLTRYRLSGLNFDSQTFLAMGANEELYGGKFWNGFKQVADIAMLPFKAVESANREAALLAAMEVFAKKDGININKDLNEAQFDELYNKAVKFVDTVHFMGAGNLPINVQKSALAKTILAMQSYGINFFNLIYNRMTSADKKQTEVVFKILGMIFMLGGTMASLPMADDMNKILRKLLGRDLKLEAEKALGKITHEDFAAFIMHGAPTLLGGNISNNINIRLPFISGIIGASDLGVGATGAMGTIAFDKLPKMIDYASNGEFLKAVGAGAPEAMARIARAYNEATRGFTTQQGAPVYFEGKKLVSTPYEALFKGITGFRSEKESKIADVRFSEYQLKTQAVEAKSKAIWAFINGDKSAIENYNEKWKSRGWDNFTDRIKGKDILAARKRKQDERSKKHQREYA